MVGLSHSASQGRLTPDRMGRLSLGGDGIGFYVEDRFHFATEGFGKLSKVGAGNNSRSGNPGLSLEPPY